MSFFAVFSPAPDGAPGFASLAPSLLVPLGPAIAPVLSPTLSPICGCCGIGRGGSCIGDAPGGDGGGAGGRSGIEGNGGGDAKFCSAKAAMGE